MNESSVSAHVHAGPRPTCAERMVRAAGAVYGKGVYNTATCKDEASAVLLRAALQGANYLSFRPPFLVDGKWTVSFR